MLKKFLQSIFKGTTPDDRGHSGSEAVEGSRPAEGSPPSEGTPPAEGSETVGIRSGTLDVGDVIADLREFVRSTIPDPIPLDEIDPLMHLYDAGYVTSVTAADLLAHIETRYGLDVSETQLIGRLQNLDALSRYIVES